MPRIFILFVAFIGMASAPTFASSPCMEPTKSWFNENVIWPSDSVVHVRIEDYSGSISNVIGLKWTNAAVIETLYGTEQAGETIRIKNWQAYDQPLYPHAKGSQLILWLKKSGGNYEITSLEWDHCVPGVWQLNEEQQVYSPVDKRQVSMEEIKGYIAQVHATGE
ncbi:MAG: hypothetical protein AB7L92_02300 [Alphaproteobacteria bacterium]